MLEAVFLSLALGTTNNIAEAQAQPTMSISQMKKLSASKRVLVKNCNSCGHTLPLEARTCTFCGSRLGYNRLPENARPPGRPGHVYGPPRPIHNNTSIIKDAFKNVIKKRTQNSRPNNDTTVTQAKRPARPQVVPPRPVYAPPRPNNDTAVTQANRPARPQVVPPRPVYGPPRPNSDTAVTQAKRPVGPQVVPPRPVYGPPRPIHNNTSIIMERTQNSRPKNDTTVTQSKRPPRSNNKNLAKIFASILLNRPPNRDTTVTQSNRPARAKAATPSPTPGHGKPKAVKNKPKQNYNGHSKKGKDNKNA